MISKFLTWLKVESIALLGIAILASLVRTLRWRVRYVNFDLTDLPKHNNYLLAFWHGRQLLMPWVVIKGIPVLNRNCYALISQHTDGRIIARIVSYLRFKSIAGSSSRGGSAALGQLIEVVKQGQSIAVTPDGPRGPRYKAKMGVLKVAQNTGVPILPMAFAAERRWTFSSWDGMILPKPFSRVLAVIGKPFFVSATDDLQQKAKELAIEISTLTLEADLSLGCEADPLLVQYTVSEDRSYEANA